jgi:lysophospholipase L1-like esterase
MKGTRQQILASCVVLVISAALSAQTRQPRSAGNPEPIAEAGWLRTVGSHQQQLANQPCRVCFIGDSLTESWTYSGRATWDAEFAPLKSINLGIAGDRTEHVLNRIHRLEFHRANPQVIVLLMGTNNLAMVPPDAPKDVVEAIKKGVSMLRNKVPQASILVLDIPPNGDAPDTALRQGIKEANALLSKIPWPDRVKLQPIHDAMIDEHGHWHKGFTLDGTHFSDAGYSKLGELIAPVLKEMLASKAKP